MAPTARRAADCLFGALLILLILDPPGMAAIPLCAGLAWLFAWMVALPLAGLHRVWPAGAISVALTTALVVAAQPWALPTGWPVWVGALAVGAASVWMPKGALRWMAVGVAAAALAGDELLFRGLYPSLHLAMAMLGVASAAAALHLLTQRPMAGAYALHIAGAACLIAALLPAASSAETRRALRGQSAIGAKLLLIAWAATDVDGDGRSHLFGGGDPDPMTPTPAVHPTPTAAAAPTQPLPPRPVLVVTADSLRADAVSAYGIWKPASTPHIDELAQRAWRFARAYAEVPATVPSFRAMLAGGVCGPARAVLPARTHLRPVFEGAGFAVVESEELAAARAAVAALASEGGLTWIHLWPPHAPYPGPGGTPRERYANGVTQFDEAAGALIAAAPEDAAIVLTSDHGEAFAEHGASYHRTSVYDEQVRVPLVIRPGPGSTPEVVAEAVGLRDLGATLRHLRGCPDRPEGASLIARPLPSSTDRPIHLRTLRLEGAFGPPASMRGVVRGRWKLVHRVDWNLSELYDLEAGTAEYVDLASERPDLVADLLALR